MGSEKTQRQGAGSQKASIFPQAVKSCRNRNLKTFGL
jgi:hypothetical protein